ncbi:hypothetical protein QN362_07395 [Actimicrobium sp. CCC2.4]|nr:hypothetical protein [Actimicrobium sp. CCC2.4]MEB0135152.1 hypothetical protein [Actimicrobium sp. CCC2.4]WPX30950.1 hypothetical protein RHM62_11850 [Actimicrobium sp. CCC2.4]
MQVNSVTTLCNRPDGGCIDQSLFFKRMPEGREWMARPELAGL